MSPRIFCLAPFALLASCVAVDTRAYGETQSPVDAAAPVLIYESTADLPPERGEWIKVGVISARNTFWAGEEKLMEGIYREARALGADAIILPSQVGTEHARSILRRSEPFGDADPAIERGRVDEQVFETVTQLGIERRPWRGHIAAIHVLAIKWKSPAGPGGSVN